MSVHRKATRTAADGRVSPHDENFVRCVRSRPAESYSAEHPTKTVKTNIKPKPPAKQPQKAVRTGHKLFVTTASALCFVLTTQAQAAVSLGTAANFGVLAGSTITNTGFTDVIGDIGVHPGSAITGFFGTVENEGPGTFTGSAHQADSIAAQAQIDANDAFTDLNNLPVNTTLNVELGGLTLTPGVYLLGSAGLTGTLTLAGGGEYIFQIGDTLITAESSMINLIGGAAASEVFWAVGSSTTLGENTDFAGTIISSESISLNAGANVDGRLIALNGAVTLISNTIVPEPSGLSLLAVLSIGFIVRRSRAGS